jgi:tetrahydromethanopterin S-methyltransferase subunit G
LFLDQLERRPMREIREMRRRCQDLETSVSYLRRLVQGRLDIAATELVRRREGGDPADLRSLIDRLPAVLAEHTRGAASGRLPTSFAPGDLRGEMAEELMAIDSAARLAEIDVVSDDELAQISERLADLERRVSDLRSALFSRIDTLGEELARRYRSGEASLGDLLRRAE